MGSGFKRFIDFSPLSVKCLNDQLEQLWLKVMGGISYRDLDTGTQNIIQSKTDEEDVLSIVEQSKDEILLAVGSPGGDNLIKNGNWVFGTESWSCNSASILDGFMHINTGNIMQEGIRVEAGKDYTFGFEGYGNTLSAAGVYGMYSALDTAPILIAQISMPTDTFADKYRVSFTVPDGIVQCYVKIETSGSFYAKKVFFREGNSVDEYTTNPNELSGSGLSITENTVNISTSNFNLDVKDEDGNVISVLTADGSGFENIQCKRISINNREFVSSTPTEIYVNSETGNDSNSGTSTYYPFKTLGRAIKAIPYHFAGQCTIHLSGGTYYEGFFLNYGGSGRITILGENATIYGRLQFYSCGYNVSLQNIKIYSPTNNCILANGHNGYIDLTQCLLDCNKLTGSRGVSLSHGFKMYMKNCEINNCSTAILCTKSSYLDIVDCKGNNNDIAISVTDMGIVNVEGTVPIGTTITQEDTGGRIDGYIVAGTVGTDYLSPRAPIKTVNYAVKTKFTHTKSGRLNNVMKQGNGCGTFLIFDTDTIASELGGKTIKSVKLYVRRRNDDALTHDAILKGFSHNVPSIDTAFSYSVGYGDLGKIRRGETVTLDIPVNLIEKFVLGLSKGLLLYDNSGEKEYCCELDASYNTRLEVQYV